MHKSKTRSAVDTALLDSVWTYIIAHFFAASLWEVFFTLAPR